MRNFGRSGTVLDTPDTLVSILNLTTLYCKKLIFLVIGVTADLLLLRMYSQLGSDNGLNGCSRKAVPALGLGSRS